MRIIRKLFLCLISIFFIWLGIYVFNQTTDGFSIRQMTSSLPPYPQYQVNLSESLKERIQVLLHQNFHYIGKGCQFYVFESEDGQYVIKFLKHKHLRPFTWLKEIPMPKRWQQAAAEKIARRQERVERLFTSCKLAFERMSEETGLLYIHLNREPVLEKVVTLIDKIGCRHRIDIDNYEFVIQQKALTVKEVFSQESKEEVEKRIKQLAALVVARCEKGIGDRDRSFVQNVAFSTDKKNALFVDIGQFYEDVSLKNQDLLQKEVMRRLGNLRYWMQKKIPELVHCMAGIEDRKVIAE
jgi:hypothetical protein